jgi:TolA-binding protein
MPKSGLEERVAKLEGKVSELSKRIDDLRNDMNHRFSLLSWEIRIWFIILMAVISIWSWIILRA